MTDLRSLGHRRIANARAAKQAKYGGWAVYHAPAPDSDAGLVLAVIRRAKGLPNWAIARAAKMSRERVRYACQYLKDRGMVFPHRTEFDTADGSGERVQYCWFAGAKPSRDPVMVDTSRCRVSMGYGRTCDTRLEEHITLYGRVTYSCPACDRRNRGLCRTCPRPIVREASDGPAPWFCPACLKMRRKERNAARSVTPEYRAQHAAAERARVARCKAAGIPHRYDRKAA